MTDLPTNDAVRVWQPGSRLLTVGVITVVMLVASEALAIATVMPLVERDLGQLWLYGWVFSAFFLGSLLGIVIAGRAADRVSIVVPFAVGLLLFASGLLLGGLANSMSMLIGARALQGVGAGALPAIAYVCIGRGFDAAIRPRLIAILSTAWVVPSLVAPAIAGVVGEHVGWRWVFLGLLPLVFIFGTVAVIGVRRIPVPEVPGEGTPLLTTFAVTAGTALVLAGLSTHHLIKAPILVAVGIGIGFRSLKKLLPPGTLTARPGLPSAILTRGMLTMAFFCTDAYVPLTLAEARGMSPSMTGLLLVFSSGGWTVGSWIQERRIRHDGPRLLVTTGFAVIAVGAALFSLMVWPAVPTIVGYLAWAVAGLGMGTAYASVAVTVLAEAEPGREGAASSSLQLSDQLGIALGTGVGGALVAAGSAAAWSLGGYLMPVFVVSVVVALVGVIVARRIPTRVTVEASG